MNPSRRHVAFQSIMMWLMVYSIIGCDQFEFSPNQSSDRSSAVNNNYQNISKLRQHAGDDTVTIVLSGDSQRWYGEQERFVNKVNSLPEVDLVLLAGDISDFGLLQEFKWVHKRLSKLHAPYFGVVGNHDLVGNGQAVFENMFGPLNYTFVYGGIKFIAHNTNALERPGQNVPDIGWLASELKNKEKADYIITVSHVPPFSPLEFGEASVQPYTKLLRDTPNLLISLHGHVHEHRDLFPYEDGVHYMTSFSYQQSAFVLLKIIKGKVYKTIIDY